MQIQHIAKLASNVEPRTGATSRVPTTPAGRWLARRHGVPPSIADAIAEMAGFHPGPRYFVGLNDATDVRTGGAA